MGEADVTVSKRRIVSYYVAVAMAVIVVAVVVFTAGAAKEAEPKIAGGYDVSAGAACIGAQVDVLQSGQFVSLARPDGENAGKLRLENGQLTGSARCRNGDEQPLAARIDDGVLTGTLAGTRLRADFKREPPDPGEQRPRPPLTIHGTYRVVPRSECLGGGFELEGPNRHVELKGRNGASGQLRYDRSGVLTGTVTCIGAEKLTAKLTGQASNRDILLTVERAGAPAQKVSAQKQREFGKTLAAFFLAVVAIMLAARFTGAAFVRIGQPRVMGEVTAGILLGPTVLGALFPELQRALFPADVIPLIGVAANLGLVFYMFLVGLELDLSQLKGRIAQTAAISNTGVAIPMIAGLAVAVPTYELLGPDSKGGFAAFALFMGVAMSITAFPVLARILVERRMLNRPIGAIALASAAIDDITAWFLIALATAIATSGGASDLIRTMALAAVFCAVMALGVRRLLARASTAYDEAGRVPVGWITAIFAGVLLSAFATEEIGIALIFGAFVMGTVMPRNAGLTEDVTRRMDDFVVLLLLPLFFAFTGLRTNVGLIDRSELIVVTIVLLLVAIVSKFGGTMIAARVTGLGWRESAVIGTLMNTRGLTELIVLNLALEKGVISDALFAALVLMALVTTFMTGPVLNRLDPRNEFGAPVEDELDVADADVADDAIVPIPERSILVAPLTNEATPQLLALAAPLARSEPPRGLILARLVAPPRAASVRGGLQTERFLLAEASTEVEARRVELLERGIAARAVAFTSQNPGRDLARLAERENVDLLMLDGRRPLLGGGVPRGEVGTALADAPSDVAVLVSRDTAVVEPGPDAPIVVPFGGAEHDWAALELGAWLATATGAPLRLLGSAARDDGDGEDGEDASRLLASASLVLQRLAGISAEPLIAESGKTGLLSAAADAGLLVIGLSERWRQEGLGATRSDIARSAAAPILFVRRGVRPGALAPTDDVTRFSWSSPNIAQA